MDWFIILRNITFFFATVMLFKYFVFLVVAPFYPYKENRRKLRELNHRHRKGKVTGLESPLVSVVIPAWNEEVGVIKTITSVLKNNYKNIEIVVVNDGSTDNTDLVIRRFIAKYKISSKRLRYFSKKNGGKGEALNFGIKNSTGDIIVTMDADSSIRSNAIENLVVYFEDDTVSAVVGDVKVAGKLSLLNLLQRLEYLFGFYFKRAHAVMGAEYIFGGACAAFRRDRVFDSIGLFDTVNKTEDIEMSLRIRYFGLKCTYAEDVVAFTEGASTINGLINQRIRWKKGRFDTFVKYRQIFFSTKKHHNNFLSYFILPFSLLAEIQLLFEPAAITLLVTYSIITGDFLSLALGILFIFSIYLVNSLFSHEKQQFRILLAFPFTWPLFYILVWVEYLALTRSIWMGLRGEEVEWQEWKRQGIGDVK